MKGRTPLLSSRAVLGWYFEQLALDPKLDLVEDLMGAPFPSDQESEMYPWLGMVPAMREWVGGRNAKSLGESSLTLTNKEYEATLEILMKDWKRDKTDQYRRRVQEMTARGGSSHWASLLCTLILDGETTICYDEMYFFDTTHSEGDSGSQSNLLTVDIRGTGSVHGSTTRPSPAEMALCIRRGIQAIRDSRRSGRTVQRDGHAVPGGIRIYPRGCRGRGHIKPLPGQGRGERHSGQHAVFPEGILLGEARYPHDEYRYLQNRRLSQAVHRPGGDTA